MKKKAQMEVPAVLPMFMAIAAAVFIFLIIFFLINGFGEKNGLGENSGHPDIKKKLIDIENRYLIIQFLRSEIEYNGEKMSMGEMLGYIDDDNGDMVKIFQDKAKIFDSISSFKTYYGVRIYPPNSDYKEEPPERYNLFSYGSSIHSCNDNNGMVTKFRIPKSASYGNDYVVVAICIGNSENVINSAYSEKLLYQGTPKVKIKEGGTK